MDVSVLVSPAAGRGRARAVGGSVVDALREAGLRPRVLPATTVAEAQRQGAEAVAGGTGALVAVGGDGAVDAALPAVAGARTPLAVVPAGTGNDLALALGIPRDPMVSARAAAEDLLAGRVRTIDAGRTSGR